MSKLLDILDRRIADLRAELTKANDWVYELTLKQLEAVRAELAAELARTESSSLHFMAADFSGLPHPFMVPLDADEKEYLARRCNEKLAAWLEKAPVVYGFIHPDGYTLLDTHCEGSETHKARLVEVAPLKGDK